MRAGLDGLLVPDPDLPGASERTRHSWLKEGATANTLRAILGQLEKLSFLRALGADGLDLSVLKPNRLKFLASLGRRHTNQALSRLAPERLGEFVEESGRLARPLDDNYYGFFADHHAPSTEGAKLADPETPSGCGRDARTFSCAMGPEQRQDQPLARDPAPPGQLPRGRPVPNQTPPPALPG